MPSNCLETSICYKQQLIKPTALKKTVDETITNYFAEMYIVHQCPARIFGVFHSYETCFSRFLRILEVQKYKAMAYPK